MIYGYYRKELQQSKSYAFIKKYSVLLWSLPIIISFYLFYQSPNIIDEVKKDRKEVSKIESIKLALDNIKENNNNQNNKNFNLNNSLNLNENVENELKGQGKSKIRYKETKKTYNNDRIISLDTSNNFTSNKLKVTDNESYKIDNKAHNIFVNMADKRYKQNTQDLTLYLFEDNAAGISIVRIRDTMNLLNLSKPYLDSNKLISNKNKLYKDISADKNSNHNNTSSIHNGIQKEIVRHIISRLQRPKKIYGKTYKSLIPLQTKLLSVEITANKLLILNFSEEFLNNYYGMEGGKMKVAHIILTLSELPFVSYVDFYINGVKPKYLDREGIIANNRENLELIVAQMLAEYVR